MKICFLGTGAADFSEELTKDAAFGLNDKSVRRSTSTLIDGKILIDCGPHVLRSLSLFNKCAGGIEHLIITHFHDDHFCLENVRKLAGSTDGVLNIWYNGENSFPDVDNAVLHPMKADKRYMIGEYSVIPRRANHVEFPFHYEITGDKSLYYALDGAWVIDETFRKIFRKNFDALIIDATVGDYHGDERIFSHNSIPMVRALVELFKRGAVIKPEARIFLDHIAVSLNPSYEEQVEIVKADGFTVAYDGMETEL